MSVTLQVWHVLVVLTVIGWVAQAMRSVPRSQGDYDFGPAFTSLARLVVATVLTLVVWLAYFAGRVILG